ncbi:MAG: elongation factor G [bacterium]
MNEIPAEQKRNIVIVGHHGAGKTSLIESFLYNTGALDRRGSIGEGNTFSDYLDEERDKKITLSSKIIRCTYKGTHFTFIDTPGYSDFIGEILASIRVADGALLVINAESGVEVETEKIWEYLDKYNVPRVVVVNRMDKERADYDAALQALENDLGAKVVPVRFPVGKHTDFKAVIDVLSGKKQQFNEKGTVEREENLPDDLSDRYEEYHERLMDAAVETDEALMERYLEGETISHDDIRKGLQTAAMTGGAVPVFCTDAISGVGIGPLLEGLATLLPDPLQRATVTIIKGEEKKSLEISEDGPGLGIVFKSLIDPFVGKMSFVRVFAGTLTSDVALYDLTKDGRHERISHLLAVNGKTHNNIAHARAGDIVALTKVDIFDAGDTVSSELGKWLIPPTEYPPHGVHLAVHGESKGDEDKIAGTIPKIVAGDRTIVFERNHETHESILSGMGELQLDLVAQRVKKAANLNVILSTPKVAYRETISVKGEGSYRHKKQSGGRGQFGEVHIRLSPLERGKEFEFEDSIFGGAIPSKFVPSVEKGIREAMGRGVIAGFPVVDVHVELFDGKYHDVDSSDMAFKIAGSMAFQQVIRERCKPILLEPIMNVVVRAPEAMMGDVMGDLNGRRGRVMGMDSERGKQTIRAQVPLAEMYRYPIELRSITRGRGSYVMEFSHYEQVPPDLAEKIIASSEKAKDGDEG